MLSNGEDDKTVIITLPIKGSPAEKAGIKKDDVVLQVGKVVVGSLDQTIKAVRDAKPGEKLDIKVRRDGKEKTVTVKVGAFPFHLATGLE
jgi:S1-C subfamily serine protease